MKEFKKQIINAIIEKARGCKIVSLFETAQELEFDDGSEFIESD